MFNNSSKKQGFTIIEITLILLIASIIFLMVFIALPSFQRTMYDTERRNDIDRLSASLVEYIVNNNKLPDNGSNISSFPIKTTTDPITSELQQFTISYLLDEGRETFEDNSGTYYYLDMIECIGGDECTNNDKSFNYETPSIHIFSNAKCGTEEKIQYSKGFRKFAVSMFLETGGYYCVDNS